jgi:hypothetical protein
MNICLWCGRDCSFLSTCEGLCVPCGDRIQSALKTELITALVGGRQAIESHKAAWASVRSILGLPESHPSGSQIDVGDAIRGLQEDAERLTARWLKAAPVMKSTDR